MIKWITLVFCLFSIELNAQIDLKNLKLTDSNLNILYRGIENRILVTGLEFDTTLKLISTNSFVIKEKINFDNNNYFYLSQSSLKDDTLKLYKGNKLLLTKVYKVERRGYPKIQFGNTSDTFLSVKQILINPKLNVVIPNSYYKHGGFITSFELKLLDSENNIIKQFVMKERGELAKNLISCMKKLSVGDKLEFTNIKAVSSDCEVQKLSDFTLTIK